MSGEAFPGNGSVFKDRGVEDLPTEQTPPPYQWLAGDRPLCILQRDGGHQAAAPRAGHMPAFLGWGAEFYARGVEYVKGL